MAKGTAIIELRDGDVRVGPDEVCVIPCGMKHGQTAEEEVDLLLLEAAGTPDTGNAATADIKNTI